MTLVVVNCVASLLVAAALVRAKARRVERTEEGRAVLVLLAAFLGSSVAGLSRRADLPIADNVALAAWTAIAAAATWVLSHSHRVDSAHPDKETP